MIHSILIFRIGQLGDTIISLPALHALKAHYPKARLTMLSERHAESRYVLSEEVLKGSGLVDDFAYYPVPASASGIWSRSRAWLALLHKIRTARYDLLVYLAPSHRQPKQIRRDKFFFGLAGIKKCVGFQGLLPPPTTTPDSRWPKVPHEADQLLMRLECSGIPVPAPGEGSMDLRLGDAEASQVSHWMKSERPAGGNPWIGVGPGSKMPSKKWPAQCYASVVSQLIQRFNVWPVVVGGAEDREIGNRLLQDWHRGWNAAGKLNPRASASLLSQCAMYVGNDTGTMHLAAAAGTPCVAVFSARDWPGKWDPYGVPHKVLRASVDCEGCGLTVCTDNRNACLHTIEERDVLQSCAQILESYVSEARPA